MSVRPVYVGVGECACGRLDVQLYHVPELRSSCAWCMADHGHLVQRPRTADDVEEVNGKTQWREPLAEPLILGEMDLGLGHKFEAVLNGDEHLAGWFHIHPDARNPRVTCRSFCAVCPLDGIPVHQVVVADPLTLSPSLECRMCGSHGHVVKGRWEPC